MLNPNEIRDLIEQDKFELLMRMPFFGRIICSSEFVIVRDPRVQMACTDYRRIFISADTYPHLPEEFRLAVLAHEVLHIALRHAFRIGCREKNRFEIAADIEVFFLLKDSFPDNYGIGILCCEEWQDLTAEQIYELLPREKKQKQKSMHCTPGDASDDGTPSNKETQSPEKQPRNDKSDSKPSGNKRSEGRRSAGNQPSTENQSTDGNPSDDGDSGNGNGDGVGEQSAENQKNAGKGNSGNDKSDSKPSGNKRSGGRRSAGNQPSTENQSTDGNPSDDGDSGNGNGDGVGNTMDTRDDDSAGHGNQEEFSEFHPRFDAETEMYCNGLSAGMRMDIKMNRQDISSAAIERLLKKLDKPRVRWETVLRQFLRLYRGGSYSWAHPNRRFISQNLYLPGRYGRKSFSGIVALDTSPSTWEALPRFVSELTGLLAEFGKYDLTIIECAAKVLQVWSVSSETNCDITQHKFRCGSGTKFSPVFEYIHDHNLTPNVLVYFTDGEGPSPNSTPTYPVIWMLAKGGKAPAPWGRAINYEEN